MLLSGHTPYLHHKRLQYGLCPMSREQENNSARKFVLSREYIMPNIQLCCHYFYELPYLMLSIHMPL